jgi:hypothetical protein
LTCGNAELFNEMVTVGKNANAAVEVLEGEAKEFEELPVKPVVDIEAGGNGHQELNVEVVVEVVSTPGGMIYKALFVVELSCA